MAWFSHLCTCHKQGGEFPSSYHVVVVFNDLRKLFVLLILEELFNWKRILGICEVYRTAVSVAINYVRELYFLHMARCTHLFSELFSFNFLQTHLTIIL
jgi:hypothetical protein